jgi:hypothetical protein
VWRGIASFHGKRDCGGGQTGRVGRGWLLHRGRHVTAQTPQFFARRAKTEGGRRRTGNSAFGPCSGSVHHLRCFGHRRRQCLLVHRPPTSTPGIRRGCWATRESCSRSKGIENESAPSPCWMDGFWRLPVYMQRAARRYVQRPWDRPGRIMAAGGIRFRCAL